MRCVTRSGVALVAFAMLAAACGGESSSDGGAADTAVAGALSALDIERSLEIGMRDVAFDRDRLEIAAGVLVELAIRNDGNLTHDFTIKDVPAEAEIPGRGSAGSERFDVHVVVDGREDARLLLRVAEPGEYAFFCAVPGHRQAGMEGTLAVR